MKFYTIKTHTNRLSSKTSGNLKLFSGIYCFDTMIKDIICKTVLEESKNLENLLLLDEFNTLEEAEFNFDILDLHRKTLENIYYEPINKTVVYVDGSFIERKFSPISAKNEKIPVMGLGAVILRPNKVPIYLLQRLGMTGDYLPTSSGTAELLSAIKVLQFCRYLNIKEIELKYDFNLVESLVNPLVLNNFKDKDNEKLIKKNLSEKELTRLKQKHTMFTYYYNTYKNLIKEMDITFTKVKSHSGIYFQEQVDRLAKVSTTL